MENINSANLLELWKNTKPIAWSTSTTQKISPTSLENFISVHNDIKSFTLENGGELLNTILNRTPKQLIDVTAPERMNPQDWLWDHLVTGKISSLHVLRLLHEKKRKKAYAFYQDILFVTDFLSFCSSKAEVSIHLLGDDHLKESMFTDYLSKNEISIDKQQLLKTLFSRCFPSQQLSVTANKQEAMKLISHPLLDRYITSLKEEGVSEYTLYFCKHSCSRFLIWVHQTLVRFHPYSPETIPIFLVQSSDLTTYKQYLIKQYQHGYIGDHKASDIFYYVRAWFGLLSQLELIPKDICLGVKAISFERHHERDLPTDEELQQFFRVVNSYSPSPKIHITAFSLMVYLGLRIKEVGRLQWEDLNLSTKTIVVHGKGNQFDLLPLPAVLVDMLTDLQKKDRLVGNIFNTSSKRFMKNLYQWYKIYALIAGWSYPGGVHIFRHCYITTLSKLKCPPQLLMHLARHKRPETTTRYIHRNNELPDAVNKINYF
ncbi:tyrosine-type recombinase/integrase [Paenibacillus glacialis]|uniref:Tyr recombinase domain-containing protein n=1 Tax=Paenibacillus glacialis TaxID=494026 RepID=A0A168C2T6_9BACL|nr:tyrosine-type recombinase/integrase [Paenibacillus glacialis]OAB32995.1 hypothetical protein PGLA_26310 [Paenibacillus glacialis]